MIDFSSWYQHFDASQFFQDFLPEDLIMRREDIIKQPYQKYIKNGNILGTVKSLNLSVLEFQQTSESDPRVSLAKEAFRIMADHRIRRGLVVFWNPETQNWRLSLMTISLEIDEKNNVVRNYSNTRRYSFFLWERAKVRTPKIYLQDKWKVKDFDDLISRFSVEVVNKAFFADIAKYFTKLVSGKNEQWDQLILPIFSSEISKNSQEFAVRLIGRLVFCWFLKQKQWSTIPLIPESILSSSAVVGHGNYYHDAVEPLFFELLNKDQNHRNSEHISDVFDTIPYLNWWLFSPHKLDYYAPQYRESLRISNDWFEWFFTLLETYNFTIDENTLIDQELSVDPEMLGRIFENLLAEINPETGESARKSTGSFYTPREIVEYMVDESLISFLEIQTKIPRNKLSALVSYDQDDDREYPLAEDEKLKIIGILDGCRILDPACGSWAFPIGTLQKILYILQVVDPNGQKWFDRKLSGIEDEMMKDVIRSRFEEDNLDYVRKLGIIKDTIFGVDIQPIAVEIAKLRCFLTLIVEEKINDTKKNRGIEPLPNLDFKFVCANSLIPLAQEKGIYDIKNLDSKLKRIRERYFDPKKSKEEKEKLKTEFRTLIQKESLFASDREKLIQTYDPFTPESCAWFFEPRFMLWVDNFDIVIWNPPYIWYKWNITLFEKIKNTSFWKKYHTKEMDYWYYFAHLWLDLLNPKWILTLITTNYWKNAHGAKKLRESIAKGYLILLFDFWDQRIFESALGQHNNIFSVSKTRLNDSVRILKDNTLDLKVILHSDNIFDYIWDCFDENKNIYFHRGLNSSIINKVKLGVRLWSSCHISSWIKTWSDYVSNEHILKYGAGFEKDEGIFILDIPETQKLIWEWLNERYLGNFYKNSDVNKYTFLPNKYKILLALNEDDLLNSVISNHLGKFHNILVNRKARFWKLLNRLDLNFPKRDTHLFSNWTQKIVVPYRAKLNKFAFVDCEFFSAEDVYFISNFPENLKPNYLLGLLNSKLLNFYLKNNSKVKWWMMEYTSWVLKEIPIILIQHSNEWIASRIESFVDKILEAKKHDPKADTSNLEKRIDTLVYELYGLTEEEIAMLEEGE